MITHINQNLETADMLMRIDLLIKTLVHNVAQENDPDKLLRTDSFLMHEQRAERLPTQHTTWREMF